MKRRHGQEISLTDEASQSKISCQSEEANFRRHDSLSNTYKETSSGKPLKLPKNVTYYQDRKRYDQKDRNKNHYTDKLDSGRSFNRHEQHQCDNYCNKTHTYERLNSAEHLKQAINLENQKITWIRSSPADLFYIRDKKYEKSMRATSKLIALCKTFQEKCVNSAVRLQNSHFGQKANCTETCDTNVISNSQTSVNTSNNKDNDINLTENKESSPYSLHPDLSYNETRELSSSCNCSDESRQTGIVHGVFNGETPLPKCDLFSNNSERLHHYSIVISPHTNILTRFPTIINHDDHEFIFEGFSMFSHTPLEGVPVCKTTFYGIEYSIALFEEKFPDNFVVEELNLFCRYLFRDILELVDLKFKAQGDDDGCSQMHLMPKFARALPENGKELLSMNEVLSHLLKSYKPLFDNKEKEIIKNMPENQWQEYINEVFGIIVSYPGMKPCSLRVDNVDRHLLKTGLADYLEIIHCGISPRKFTFSRTSLICKSENVKTIVVSSEKCFHTGLKCDITFHAVIMSILMCHVRFHQSCSILEKLITYKFKNKSFLQVALTHTSFKGYFGTNLEHFCNTLSNCGLRSIIFGNRRKFPRKKNINDLNYKINRSCGQFQDPTESPQNRGLEFVGNAVVQFVATLHLFYLFPSWGEGVMTSYRTALVDLRHLALLGRKIELHKYLLYGNCSELDSDKKMGETIAHCFVAVMGALFLDGGIYTADRVFSEILYSHQPVLKEIWMNLPVHPLQATDPHGDRHLLGIIKSMQKLTEFENLIGFTFRNILLLAKAFTPKHAVLKYMEMGSNERLEFLGDAVLTLVVSEYLYKQFPGYEHNFGLLCSSLTNCHIQADVCNDLALTNYVRDTNFIKDNLKVKACADLLEAFIGALFVDANLEPCKVICNVCLFPRLRNFIMNYTLRDSNLDVLKFVNETERKTTAEHESSIFESKEPQL